MIANVTVTDIKHQIAALKAQQVPLLADAPMASPAFEEYSARQAQIDELESAYHGTLQAAGLSFYLLVAAWLLPYGFIGAWRLVKWLRNPANLDKLVFPLSGWQRIGVVLTFVWVIGVGFLALLVDSSGDTFIDVLHSGTLRLAAALHRQGYVAMGATRLRAAESGSAE
jgi:hypothetical protein